VGLNRMGGSVRYAAAAAATAGPVLGSGAGLLQNKFQKMSNFNLIVTTVYTVKYILKFVYIVHSRGH